MAYARVQKVALGATAVDLGLPEPGRPQSPIYPLIVGSNGGWKDVRTSPSEGACGVHGYPCQHPGIDVAGSAGTPVVAPESGTIVMVGDGNSAPYVGYGPWFAIIQGNSGKFHFLAHLEPAAAGLGPLGAQVTAGDVVGTTSSANHTHWEVRSKLVPDYASGEDNFTNNTDPIAWLSLAAIGLGTILIVGGAAVIFLLLRRR